MNTKRGINGQWSHWVFILAAVGSAVGLGNIWKFPYITGENGGGAFVLLYLICIVLIGVPIMIAEVMLGRRSQMSPVNAMLFLSRESKVSSWWVGVGCSGVLAGILILSSYSVIAGWALHYCLLSVSGALNNVDAQASSALFDGLLADARILSVWHTVFLVVVLGIVACGVVKGLGVAVRYLMPLLFVLLLVLVVYSGIEGDMATATRFLFRLDFKSLTWGSVLVALGHAFFSLSLGMGAIMAYGAYLPRSLPAGGVGQPRKISLGKTVLIIAAMDTVVALLAGFVIFPIVFANPAVSSGDGPGLLFISLPIALSSMPFGGVFATAFFFLVFVAALSSAISLIEPAVAWLVEEKSWSRGFAVMMLGGFVWLLGMGTVFSFNSAADLTFVGLTFFEMLDFITTNLLLPIGGLLIAIFVGWFMKRTLVAEELGSLDRGLYYWWYNLLRYVSPLLLGYVFVMALVDKVGG